MGGSSLGPEVVRETFGAASGMLDLVVLDSTHPQQIRETEAKLESLPHARRRSQQVRLDDRDDEPPRLLLGLALEKAEQFVAITDPGSSLAGHRPRARLPRGSSRTAPTSAAVTPYFPTSGWCRRRSSARRLSRFSTMRWQWPRVATPASHLPRTPASLSASTLAEAALDGRDKCTLVLPDSMATLGWWIEQLVAESTGKEGRGILPIEGEPLGPPARYGPDRIFVAYEDSAALRGLSQPATRSSASAPSGLGGEFFRWEFATAVAGAVLEVQPFDQPNVQEAKDAAGIILGGGSPDVTPMRLRAVLDSIEPGDYVAINAFICRNTENGNRLAAVRAALAERHHVAMTVGFGPRFLHSTGQFHKGGPPSGAFIEVVDEFSEDIAIPGRRYTFGELLRAQALGDLAALLGRGRRACRVTLEELEAAAL